MWKFILNPIGTIWRFLSKSEETYDAMMFLNRNGYEATKDYGGYDIIKNYSCILISGTASSVRAIAKAEGWKFDQD